MPHPLFQGGAKWTHHIHANIVGKSKLGVLVIALGG